MARALFIVNHSARSAPREPWLGLNGSRFTGADVMPRGQRSAIQVVVDKGASGNPKAAKATFRFLEPGLGARVLHPGAGVTWRRRPGKLPLVEEHISGFEFMRLTALIFLGGMVQMAGVAMIVAQRCWCVPAVDWWSLRR
eukprot:Skav201126  [mRNA]  locus=scaffold4373:100424:104663:+ [translate_table: standard]